MQYSYTIIGADAASNLQLQLFLEEYGEFTCADFSQNSLDGLNSILKFSPDIVFLNLNQKAAESFQMVMELHQYMKTLPIIIGISKTKQHAYTAIKNNFFDYWLLPFNEFDMRKSIFRLKKQMPQETVPQTICLQTYKDYRYIDTEEILYLKADNNATDFIMKDGNTISAYKTLKTFEGQLPENFVRIHQSYILNSKYISRINYGKSICALNKEKLELPFSKSYKENVDSLKRIMAKSSFSPHN